MCSVGDDGVDEMQAVQDQRITEHTTCRKCKGGDVRVMLRKTDPYCRSCFETYVTHKFRSCIGKHKCIPVGSRVLVAVSGGPSSHALLHLVDAAVTQQDNKKLRIQPMFLHVDMWCTGEYTSGAEQMVQAVQSLGYPCYYTSLEQQLLNRGSDSIACLPPSTCPLLGPRPTPQTKQLTALFDACHSDTDRESITQALLHGRLLSASASLGVSFLFQGHTTTHVATALLASMAQGAGARASRDTTFSHDSSNIKMLKPLMELQEEEIVYYLQLNGIQFTPRIFKPSSLHGCTQIFLKGLQAGFPSTVPTVYKTGGKLLTYKPWISDKLKDDHTGFAGRNQDTRQSSNGSPDCISDPSTLYQNSSSQENIQPERTATDADKNKNDDSFININNLTDNRESLVNPTTSCNKVNTVTDESLDDADQGNVANKIDRLITKAHVHQDRHEYIDPLCLLCYSTIDTIRPKPSAVSAIQKSISLSHEISQSHTDHLNKSLENFIITHKDMCPHIITDEYIKTHDLDHNEVYDPHKWKLYCELIQYSDLKHFLCYACGVTVKNMSDHIHLPQHLLRTALEETMYRLVETDKVAIVRVTGMQ